MVQVLKVYLLPSSYGKQEIRRVTVNSHVISSFDLLVERVIKLFPVLVGRKFTLSWRDEEQDDIVMSSDEELSQAIANSDYVMKVFVNHHDGSQPAPEENKGDVFASIICDGCDAEIRGCRYKCLECQDYDLCGKCNYENKHPHHNMIKYCSPNSVPFGASGQAYGPHGVPPFPFPFSCPGKKSNDHSSHHKRFRGKGRRNFNWNMNAEFLRNIGESVSSILDPLGIDVSVDVVTNDATPEDDEMKTEVPVKKEPVSKNNEPIAMPDVKPPPSDSSKAAEADDETENISAAKSSSSSFMFAPPKFRNGGQFGGLFLPQAPPQYASSATSTECNENKANGARPHNRTYPIIEEVVPRLVEDVKRGDVEMKEDISAISAEIARKVSTMMEMGFSNNGGWLERLLESKNGSIPDTLDYLYPNGPRN